MPIDKTSGQTESEVLFERFCEKNAIRVVAIPTGEERTPDYEFFPNENLVVAEITQLDPNQQDKQHAKDLEEKRIATAGGTVGSRVCHKIGDKASQLRVRSQGKIPAILILFNNTGECSYTSPYHIRAAMYGFDTYVFHVPKDPSQSISLADRKFGKGRKVTVQDNTSLSALGVLEYLAAGLLGLKVYHNVHARCPIDPVWFKTYPVEQFTLEPRTPGELQDWVPISGE